MASGLTVTRLNGLTDAVTGEPKAMLNVGVNDRVSILIEMEGYVMLGLESLVADKYIPPNLENSKGLKPVQSKILRWTPSQSSRRPS